MAASNQMVLSVVGAVNAMTINARIRRVVDSRSSVISQRQAARRAVRLIRARARPTSRERSASTTSQWPNRSYGPKCWNTFSDRNRQESPSSRAATNCNRSSLP
jgi:hypothetical protein